jgi:hypothetical protein
MPGMGKNLPNDLSLDLRIAVELALDDHELPRTVDPDEIGSTNPWHRKLPDKRQAFSVGEKSWRFQ